MDPNYQMKYPDPTGLIHQSIPMNLEPVEYEHIRFSHPTDNHPLNLYAMNHPQNVQIFSDSSEESSFSSGVELVSILCQYVKNDLMNNFKDTVADEGVSLILNGFPPYFARALQELLWQGQITCVCTPEEFQSIRMELQASFRSLGIHAPGTFWEPAIKPVESKMANQVGMPTGLPDHFLAYSCNGKQRIKDEPMTEEIPVDPASYDMDESNELTELPDEEEASCPTCDQVFETEAKYKWHKRHGRCRKAKSFSCRVCGTKFSSLKKRRSHEQKEHDGCNDDDDDTNERGEVKDEKGVPDEHNILHCPFCSKKFVAKKNNTLYTWIRRHIISKHRHEADVDKIKNNNDIHQYYDKKCPKCSKSFRTYSLLQKHWATEADCEIRKNEPPCCKICGETFGSQKKLISHKYEKHSGTHCCEICGNTYGSKLKLWRHKNGVHKTESVKCHLCHKVVKKIKLHLDQMHASTGHPCEICGQVIFGQLKYKRHVNGHTHQRLLKCRLCDFTALYHASRNQHEKKVHGRVLTDFEKVDRRQVKREDPSVAAAAATVGAVVPTVPTHIVPGHISGPQAPQQTIYRQ